MVFTLMLFFGYKISEKKLIINSYPGVLAQKLNGSLILETKLSEGTKFIMDIPI